MKFIFALLTILFFVACNNGNNAKSITTDTVIKDPAPDSANAHFIHEFKDTVLENRIIDTLMQLPFVKKSNAYIDSFSNHTHGISFMLDTTATGISVSAGYNGPERFENYYLFQVDPKTLQIQIADVVSGDWIPVKKYMKLKSGK